MKVHSNDNSDYEIWNTEVPEIPPRTRLYNLPPIGIGTAEVESLSGYISRLAQEHALSPVVLLKNSVRDTSELPKSILQNSISTVFAGSLNGFGTNTKLIASILQSATLRDDIRLTSLLPWKGKLSNHKLLKKHAAWCPVCFDEQREQGKIVYEKLIWNFHDNKACHTHGIPLVEQCPHCYKKPKILSGRSRPGYCSGCRKWLGSNLIRFDEFRNFKDDGEKKKELWKAIKLGELLSEVPLFTLNDYTSQFSVNLSGLIKTVACGNINDFAYQTGMWHIAVRRLLKDEVLPTIGMILNLCISLELSPVSLFEKLSDGEPQTLSPSKKNLTKEDLDGYLNLFLQEFPPPSASAVSRRSAWTTTRLQRNFPDKYKKIVENYTEYIKRKIPDLSDDDTERILIDALKQYPPPSLQSVFRKMGCKNSGYRYYQRFPVLSARIAARYKKRNLKKFNVGKASRIIDSALSENPPPSFSEIARRISCTRENLRKKFPELSLCLCERYKDYLTIFRQGNLQFLRVEMKKVLINIQAENKTISMNKVKTLLPRKWNDRNFKMIYQSLTREMNLKTEK